MIKFLKNKISLWKQKKNKKLRSEVEILKNSLQEVELKCQVAKDNYERFMVINELQKRKLTELLEAEKHDHKTQVEHLNKELDKYRAQVVEHSRRVSFLLQENSALKHTLGITNG